MIIQWCVHYVDGSRLDGPCEIPQDRRVGILAVTERDNDHGWTIWHGKDWYLLEKSGYWMGCDQTGLFDQLLFCIEQIQYCLQGRTLVPYEVYQKQLNEIIQGLNPPKTAWNFGER